MWQAIAIAVLLLTGLPAGAWEISGIGCVDDGDTIRVGAQRHRGACSGGIAVRLKGVAAPEMRERGGPAARRLMMRLVEGERVTCELTGEKSGSREIGWCHTAGVDLGAAVIAGGVARACPRYDPRYLSFERAEIAALYPLPGYCMPR